MATGTTDSLPGRAAPPDTRGSSSRPSVVTLAGGMAYGWLTWRTGSILWGALAHTYILTLVMWAAAMAAVATAG